MRRRKRKIPLVVSVGISVMIAMTLLPAAPTTVAAAGGTLAGVVLNAKGKPVGSARVLWQSADGKAPHATRTDASGHFHIAGLSQGLYELRAEAAGMVSEWQHNISVRSGGQASVTLRLSRHIAAAKPVSQGARGNL